MEIESCFENWRFVIDLAAHDSRPSTNPIKRKSFARLIHSTEGIGSGWAAPYFALFTWRKNEFIGRHYMQLLIIIWLLSMFPLGVVDYLFLLVIEDILKVRHHLCHVRSGFLLDVTPGCLRSWLLVSLDFFRDKVCRKLFSTLAVEGQNVVELLLVGNFIKYLRLKSQIRSSACRIFHF